MSTEVKQDEIQEVLDKTESEKVSELEKNEIKSMSEVDIETIKKTLLEKEEELKERQKNLEEKERELEKKYIEIYRKNTELDEREKNIELKIRKEYAEAKKNLSEEQAKSKLDFEVEISEKRDAFEKRRQKAISELGKELEGLRENIKKELDELREKQYSSLKMEREEQKIKLEEERKQALQQLEEKTKAETAKLSEKESEIEQEQEKLHDEKSRLERNKRRLEREKARIEEANDNLKELVEKESKDVIDSLHLVIETKDKELNSLREQLHTKISDIEKVTSFEKVYGDNPQVVIESMKQLEDCKKKLSDKLSNAVDRDEFDKISSDYENSKSEVKRLLEENTRLTESREKTGLLEAMVKTLESEQKSLLSTREMLENQLEAKNQELVRISSPEGRIADREASIAAIMTGALDDKKDLVGAGDGLDSRYNKKDETVWLEDVWKKCEEYGIKFNKRLLYAFHTALKINEWSTITILAGVSGTGKSELPRLYSEFGGLNFCSVAVQPNWDSQESMLGFFNSIDNQFEPEEVLKFLVQCTTDPNYNEYMSVVLLDEMNLAHVEHYFAEFLSKLESRRGLSRSYLPEIEVKLGAGVKPYGLKLSRTLLWTGTMNQDETTKSLSDKVLDRGIVINFPRPKNLESRVKMGLITDYISDDRAKLHKDTWQSWTSHTIDFSDEQKKEVENYRIIVQEINNALEEVGRALGHRVWQSIEYYIANYPTVRQAMNYQPMQNEKGRIVWVPTNSDLTGELKEAMKTAFEDQIVQKIMPKLRGIETRDKRGKSSLDKIEDLLVTHDFASLQEDFQIAREQGYGQFIWNSAKYLDKKEEKELQE